jgi:hypothetical protein
MTIEVDGGVATEKLSAGLTGLGSRIGSDKLRR